jgi:hypothetical protein
MDTIERPISEFTKKCLWKWWGKVGESVANGCKGAANGCKGAAEHWAQPLHQIYHFSVISQ